LVKGKKIWRIFYGGILLVKKLWHLRVLSKEESLKLNLFINNVGDVKGGERNFEKSYVLSGYPV
jgi:hypothetical protein